MRKILAMALLLAVVVAAQFMASRQRADVTVTRETIAGTPVEYYRGSAPPGYVAIVVHGYAGSKELMKPWGYYLARQGFETYVIDQPGHGDSTTPLPPWTSTGNNALGENLRQVISSLVESGRARPGAIALVGHSMGGTAVTTAAMADERVAATVALSSAYRAPLPADKPAKFLGLAAERDPAFMVEAVQAMSTQPGSREAGVIAGRNHITILYDAQVMARAAAWIGAGLGIKQAATNVDASFGWGWIAIALAGALGLVVAVGWFLAPAVQQRGARSNSRIGLLTGLVMVSVAALSAVLAVAYVRVPWLRMGVVDYLFPYFVVMALVLLVLRLLWPRDYGYPVASDSPANLGHTLRGLGVFLGLLGAVGSVVHTSLSNFMLNSPRVLPLVVLALAYWVYFAQEEGLKRAVAGSLGGWAAWVVGVAGKVVIVLTWLMASALPNPQPFLPLVVPVIAVVLVFLETTSQVLRQWRYSAAGSATFMALTLAWVTAATFPLQ